MIRMLFSQNKQKTCFVLGHCPQLSKAEIFKVLDFFNVEFNPVFINEQVLIIETAQTINTGEFMERLGGTVKISSIRHQASRIDLEESFNKIINKKLKELKLKDLKFQFGFSAYGGASIKDLNKIGLNIKKELTARGIKSRLVVSRASELSSVIIQKEKLIEQGADIVVVKSKDRYYSGVTSDAQKFEEYSSRDYGRPARDDVSGMMPPKLAKIMINLSQTQAEQTILDPFCGSGTLIQEALLMGYKNVIGTDISVEAIVSSRKNIGWLQEKTGNKIPMPDLRQADAKKLSQLIAPGSIDAIITEPYLGPAKALSSQGFKSKIPNLIAELEDLYQKSLEEFYKVLKTGGKAVVILPIIEKQSLNIINDIKRMGFSVESLGQEPRRSIIYSRPGQRVEREIFIFVKRE